MDTDPVIDSAVWSCWSGVRGLPRSVSEEGEEPIAEDVFVGWWLGARVSRRVRVWEPRQRGPQWVCPLEIEGRTGGRVDIPGGSAVESLVLAARVVWLFLFESLLAPDRWRGERVPMDVLCFHLDTPPEVWTAVALSGLQDAGGPRRVRIGRPVEAPNGAWWSAYELGHEVDSASAECPVMALAQACGRVAGALLDAADTTLPGYAAFTAVLWERPSTEAPWADHEPPWIEDRWGDGDAVIRLWAPREAPAGWTCALFVGPRMVRPIAVSGDGPITALIHAYVVLKRFDDDWEPELEEDDEDDEPGTSMDEYLAQDAACRARPVEPSAVRDRHEQVLRFGDTSARVFLGASYGEGPMWYCPIWTDRMSEPRQITARPTRMEVFRLAMSLLVAHLHRGEPDLSIPRREPAD